MLAVEHDRSSFSEEDARNSACSRRDGSGPSPSQCDIDQGHFSAAGVIGLPSAQVSSVRCGEWRGLPSFSLAKNAENAGVHS